MSIEKKSLISTLKTTKKVNAVSSDLNAKPSTVVPKRAGGSLKRAGVGGLKRAGVGGLKRAGAGSLKRAGVGITKREI